LHVRQLDALDALFDYELRRSNLDRRVLSTQVAVQGVNRIIHHSLQPRRRLLDRLPPGCPVVSRERLVPQIAEHRRF